MKKGKKVKKGKSKGPVAPPARKTPKKRAAPGMSHLGMTNTELGDRVEGALADLPRWRALVGKKAGRARQGIFDLEAPDGSWVEVKACTVFAAEYKSKPSRASVGAKVDGALKAGRTPSTVIAIVEEDGTVHVYRRPGVGAFRLGPQGLGWLYEGKVQIEV